MCHYKILAHNEDGYVILCHTCKHYQLAYGTTAATFSPADFKLFCRQAERLKSDFSCDGFEHQKRIPMELFCSCVNMVLSYRELEKLHGLLNEAEFNEEVDLLLGNLNMIKE